MKCLFAVFGFKTKNKMKQFLETRDPSLGLRRLVYDESEYQTGNLTVEECDVVFDHSFNLTFNYYVVLPMTVEPIVLNREMSNAG